MVPKQLCHSTVTHTIVFVIMSEMWKINKNQRMCPLDMDDPAQLENHQRHK